MVLVSAPKHEMRTTCLMRSFMALSSPSHLANSMCSLMYLSWVELKRWVTPSMAGAQVDLSVRSKFVTSWAPRDLA